MSLASSYSQTSKYLGGSMKNPWLERRKKREILELLGSLVGPLRQVIAGSKVTAKKGIVWLRKSATKILP